jgi:hypothetical protein
MVGMLIGALIGALYAAYENERRANEAEQRRMDMMDDY